MKKRFKTFTKTKEVTDVNGKKHTILVYGELSENEIRDCVRVTRLKTGKENKVIMDFVKEIAIADDDEGIYGSKKTFNMGWAICAPEDTYDEERGIKTCKRRFAISPLTTRNGNFLTLDMVNAIMTNEVDYIARHFEKYGKVSLA